MPAIHVLSVAAALFSSKLEYLPEEAMVEV